jgi:hypothetical protein
MEKQTLGNGSHGPHFPNQFIDQKAANHHLKQYLLTQDQSLRNLTHDLEKKMQLETVEPFPVVKYASFKQSYHIG